MTKRDLIVIYVGNKYCTVLCWKKEARLQNIAKMVQCYLKLLIILEMCVVATVTTALSSNLKFIERPAVSMKFVHGYHDDKCMKQIEGVQDLHTNLICKTNVPANITWQVNYFYHHLVSLKPLIRHHVVLCRI